MSPRPVSWAQPAHPPDLRPVRVSDHTLQAEAFLALFRRCGASADLEAEFQRWANSKDFGPPDRSAIAREVREILAQRGRP